MNKKRYYLYYLLVCIGVLAASYYPLSMGIRVVTDILKDGTVMKENYPKYIIPYTPISLAIILGTVLMPLCRKLWKRYALLGGGVVGIGSFFALEFVFEKKVVVTTAETVAKLEDWQMLMCYQPPGGWPVKMETTYKTQTAVDILIGNYNPWFKLHFYLISVVLILAVLNCVYGFGEMVLTGERKRKNSLLAQTAATVTFLGLCILACFTAFWRDGSLEVSPLSATLMTVFFILFGMTVGVFAGSFLLGKRKLLSTWLPGILSLVTTLLMYVGEMILLHGHLYRLGSGIFFDSIPGIILSAADIGVILLSGGLCYLICRLLQPKTEK